MIIRSRRAQLCSDRITTTEVCFHAPGFKRKTHLVLPSRTLWIFVLKSFQKAIIMCSNQVVNLYLYFALISDKNCKHLTYKTMSQIYFLAWHILKLMSPQTELNWRLGCGGASMCIELVIMRFWQDSKKQKLASVYSIRVHTFFKRTPNIANCFFKAVPIIYNL